MVSSSIIMSFLIIMAVMGLIPVLGGIILLAAKKIKASAFWTGLLTAVVSMIAVAAAEIVLAGGNPDLSIIADKKMMLAFQLVNALSDTVLIMLSFLVMLKGSRTFNGALSFGLGYGALNMIIYAVSMLGNYFIAVSINNGTFESTYSQAIEMGTITKDQVIEIKKSIIELNPAELLISFPNCLAVLLIIAAMAALIVHGTYKKKMAVVDILIAAAVRAAVAVIAVYIENQFIAVSVISVLAAAIFAYTLVIRKDMVPAAAAPEEDSFLKSVEKSKQQDGEEYNPYE